MRFTLITMLFVTAILIAQNPVELNLIKKDKVNWSKFMGQDRFESKYYLIGDDLEKLSKSEIVSYSNIQFGEIDQVDIFNSLKIALLHKNYNTIAILDNRLAEISIVNFNMISPYRTITKIANSNENSIWIFNTLNFQLELFDYNIEKTIHNTIPINENVLALQSDYNNVYALSKSYLYHYNYNGSLISKISHEGFDDFKLADNFIVFKKNNLLFYKALGNENIEVLKIQKKIIKQFFVMNQTLYIYDGEFLYNYQILKT